MRIFWAFVLVLVLVSGLVLWLDHSGSGRGGGAAMGQQPTGPRQAPPRRPAGPSPSAAGEDNSPPHSATTSEEPEDDGPETGEAASPPVTGTNAADPADDQSTTSASDADTETATTATDNSGDVESTSDESTSENPLVAAFSLPGAGTAEDPYKISWDLLLSVQQTYNPREEKAEIPDTIQRLHEKYVEITGYLMVPLGMEDADEMMVMLNMWDGCCIGVPPTPYDAVEVRLRERIDAEDARYMTYGTMTGKFLVDPYIINGWLMGMYLMEDATVEADM